MFCVQKPKVLHWNGWSLWRKGGGRGLNPACKAKWLSQGGICIQSLPGIQAAQPYNIENFLFMEHL